MHPSRTVAGVVLLALLSGCGPKLGPATHQYLTGACGALSQLDRDMAKDTIPQAPVLPDLNALPTRDAQAAALMEFSDRLTKYYSTTQQSTDMVMALCDQALAKIGASDSVGVEPQATDLVERFKVLINGRQQMAVVVDALISQQRSALRKGMVPRYALRLLAAGVDAMYSPSDRIPAGTSLTADELKPQPSEKSEATKENLGTERAIATWRSNVSETATASAELSTALKAKYGDLDWSVLTPSPTP